MNTAKQLFGFEFDNLTEHLAKAVYETVRICEFPTKLAKLKKIDELSTRVPYIYQESEIKQTMRVLAAAYLQSKELCDMSPMQGWEVLRQNDDKILSHLPAMEDMPEALSACWKAALTTCRYVGLTYHKHDKGAGE